jgi:hypothetical protein
MPSCEDMKKGQICMCKDCGLELQMVSECTTCSVSMRAPCALTCCEKELELKK